MAPALCPHRARAAAARHCPRAVWRSFNSGGGRWEPLRVRGYLKERGVAPRQDGGAPPRREGEVAGRGVRGRREDGAGLGGGGGSEGVGRREEAAVGSG